MSALIEAAKAVIAEWDNQQVVGDRKLRAAVERAEKQEVDFVKWWERTYGGKTCRAFAEDSWKTAQQAERERIKKMIDDMIDQDDPWIHFSTLLEIIDGPDDDSGEE